MVCSRVVKCWVSVRRIVLFCRLVGIKETAVETGGSWGRSSHMALRWVTCMASTGGEARIVRSPKCRVVGVLTDLKSIVVS